MKKYIMLALCALMALSPVPAAFAQESAGAASITFGAGGHRDRLEVVVTETPDKDNTAVLTSFQGEECLMLEKSAANIPVKVDKGYVGPEDRRVVLLVKFFDKGKDYIRVEHTSTQRGDKRNILIQKEGTNRWRTATILLDDVYFAGDRMHGSDFQIASLESHAVYGKEYIAGISVLNLDKAGSPVREGMLAKRDILHEMEASGLHKLGLLDAVQAQREDYGLSLPVTREQAVKAAVSLAAGGTEQLTHAVCDAVDVSEWARPYVGYAQQHGIAAVADGKLGAGELITVREGLSLFIRALGGEPGEDVIGTAKSLGLLYKLGETPTEWFGVNHYRINNTGLYGEQLLGGIDQPLFRDDLAGLMYNMLFCTRAGADKPVLSELVERGVTAGRAIAATGSKELLNFYYEKHGIQLEDTSFVDKKTGVTVHSVGLPGTNTAHMYYTGLASLDGKNIILSTALDRQGKKGFLAMYNTETGETTLIDDRYEADYYCAAFAPTNEVFYTVLDEVRGYDVDTGENRLICKQPDGIPFYGVPSVSNDGKVFTAYWKDSSDNLPRSICTVNTETGEFRQVLSSEQTKAMFEAPQNFIDHPLINPEYTDLLFHCRGSADVPDRIWTLDLTTGEHKNAYVQKRLEDGTLGESVGHEVWSYDGEKLYFVKYNSSLLSPSGVMYIDKDGGEATLVNGDFAYLHAAVSRDERYIVADTGGVLTGDQYTASIILIDTHTGEARELANVPMWSEHPGHPHPSFSLDGSKVIFTMADEQDQLRVGYIDITNLPPVEDSGAKVASILLGDPVKSDGITLFQTEDATNEAYSVLAQQGGEDCRMIQSNKKMYFDVGADYVKPSDQEVTIAVTFFDNGSDLIKLEYNCDNPNAASASEKNYKAYDIRRTNTNAWVTQEITLRDASFRSAQFNGADFRLNSNASSTPIYIKQVRAVKGGVMPEQAEGSEWPEQAVCYTVEPARGTADGIACTGDFEVQTAQGVQCAVLTGEHSVGVALDSAVRPAAGGEALVRVTYLDRGNGNIALSYNADAALPGVPSSRDYRYCGVARGDSGTWKTAVVSLPDAQFGGRQADGADFRISAADSAVPVYISKIEVIPSLADTRVKVFTAGDSTVCGYTEEQAPQTGWGMVLGELFDSAVTVDNTQSAGGRSAKSFIAENRLGYVLDNMEQGDWLFVQFGHNDMRADREDLYADPAEGGAFQQYLMQYIEGVRAKGGNPVLVTPPVKHAYDSEGALVNDLAPYAAAMRSLGVRLGVPVLDLNALTAEALSAPDGAQATQPYYMLQNADNVHFTRTGAQWLCGLIKSEIQRLGLPLAGHLAH